MGVWFGKNAQTPQGKIAAPGLKVPRNQFFKLTNCGNLTFAQILCIIYL